MKRDEILEDCPEEFKDSLVDFIDYVESKFNEIDSILDIERIDDLHRLDAARNLASETAKDLY